MRLLVTAFAAFGGRAINQSAVVLRAMQALGLPGELLPVTFAEVAARVPELVRGVDVLLMLGESGADERLAIEHTAQNVAASSRPDEAGVRVSGAPLLAGAPLALAATLTTPLLLACQRRHVPAAPSWHAGTFVCNAALYHALHAAAGAQVGFVHVPAAPRLGDPSPHVIARALAEGLGSP